MPKVKESLSEFISRIMSEKHKTVFKSDRSVLFCVVCNVQVIAKKISQVDQHIKTKYHRDAEANKENNGTSANQTLMTQFGQKSNPKLNTFHLDICELFVEANIPLSKIGHSSMGKFLNKYVNSTVPSESSLRTKYLPLLYDRCIEALRVKARGKYVWVSVDESADCEGRSVAHFVFGILNADETERGQCYLLDAKVLEATNANTIAAFFNDCMLLLYPEGKHKLILILKHNTKQFYRF